MSHNSHSPWIRRSFRLVSIVLLLCLCTANLEPAVRAATSAPRLVGSQDLNKARTPVTCIRNDDQNRVSVDTSIENGATQGCLMDYSNFPVVRVSVSNTHSFWTKVRLFDSFGTQHVQPANIWASFGYIAPGDVAEYEITFHSTLDSQ